MTDGATAPQGSLQRVCDIARLPAGRSIAIRVAGEDVAVFATAGGYFAISNRCPHEGAPLAGCPVLGEAVVCSRHGWRIRLPATASGASDGLRRYETRVQDGAVYILLP